MMQLLIITCEQNKNIVQHTKYDLTQILHEITTIYYNIQQHTTTYMYTSIQEYTTLYNNIQQYINKISIHMHHRTYRNNLRNHIQYNTYSYQLDLHEVIILSFHGCSYVVALIGRAVRHWTESDQNMYN